MGSIQINGGVGNDTIEDRPHSGAVVSGGDGADTITAWPNAAGQMSVQGDADNDSIAALAGVGVIDGGADNDAITLSSVNPFAIFGSAAFGGSGNDHFVADGPTSVSLLDGGDGSDRISTDGFAKATRMDGGVGKDRITSTNMTGATPFLYPAEIAGGPGPDNINGGGVGDTIDCETENDHYKLYAGDAIVNCEVPY